MKKKILAIVLAVLVVQIGTISDVNAVTKTNEILKETIGENGVKTVINLEKFSDDSIKETRTQSDGFVIEYTYYPDGSSIEKIYENENLILSHEYDEGTYFSTYKTLYESISKENNEENEDDFSYNRDKMGNTNANFNKSGPMMACENGNIYYIDSYWDGMSQSCIYKMDSNGNNISSITGYSNIKYENLNVLDGYIYYTDYVKQEICKMKADGSDKKSIYDGKVSHMIVYDEYIYFVESNDKKIYRMKIDGSGKIELANISDSLGCDFFNIEGKYIYYSIIKGKIGGAFNVTYINTYRMNLNGFNKQSIGSTRVSNSYSQVYEKSIYEKHKEIVKLDKDAQEKRINITCRDKYKLGLFNIYDGWIYYTDRAYEYAPYEGQRLYKCRLDGSNNTLLYEPKHYGAMGQHIAEINVDGEWISIQLTDRDREYIGLRRMFVKTDGSKVIPFEKSMTINMQGTGWKKVRGNWYYYNEDGIKKIGWFQDSNGKWYYFAEDGIMVQDQYIDEYYFDSDGVWNPDR
ncbi:DUF5050 domain-containing protein [Clostridium botulinum]|uniref:DUF5050 domain-containing protein n=1 Tax=Clostridium botulinum TaxID=1491 RepID=UPI0007748446|nr:DUF5050 domain-containing protein [Clostridium botulinum]NFL38718.1 DUF5050 domain-containing protein [Clostridium botulinum]NFL66816.1 DUF5050 domain-containing protein [Clostridium botulinum]NFN09688.1 DUF5050 domain-containing protein [Clostridium botulinum]NFN24541.1 DUF5050 domain-containing protein [Clostridium botulinum]NFN31810.1 DUF5050 domain-containing protein [Clostridium botulinum]